MCVPDESSVQFGAPGLGVRLIYMHYDQLHYLPCDSTVDSSMSRVLARVDIVDGTLVLLMPWMLFTRPCPADRIH